MRCLGTLTFLFFYHHSKNYQLCQSHSTLSNKLYRSGFPWAFETAITTQMCTGVINIQREKLISIARHVFTNDVSRAPQGFALVCVWKMYHTESKKKKKTTYDWLSTGWRLARRLEKVSTWQQSNCSQGWGWSQEVDCSQPLYRDCLERTCFIADNGSGFFFCCRGGNVMILRAH